MGRPKNDKCTLCAENPKGKDRQWCPRCWRLYQRCRRSGASTKKFLADMRRVYGTSVKARAAKKAKKEKAERPREAA
jgi:hypothetical protein